MRKRGKSNTPKTRASHERKIDLKLEDLHDVLEVMRESHHIAAEKPAFYWKKQQDAILAKLDAPATAPALKFRFAYVCIPVVAVALLCLFFLAGNSKTPAPDMAAGYDQDLLVEVDRALGRNYPLALKPAALLAQEIEQGAVSK
ncbi:MAG: hypothetical protein P8Y80_10655 [Acidobacteriota bacterium]|jgi:hypothetical protein